MFIEKIKAITKNKKLPILICAATGLLLILLSVISHIGGKETATESHTEKALEMRLEKIIAHATGDSSVRVMITTEMQATKTDENAAKAGNLIQQLTLSDDSVQPQAETKIAGVMIVCKSIDSAGDLSTIKQAAATTLDIPLSKIYIIGGKGEK